MLLQNGGKHRGRQLLSRAKLAQALNKTEKRGISTNLYNGYGYRWYNMSFWSAPYRTQNYCFFQIPYIAGYLGNLVVLLPNGISAFRIADGNHYDPESLILGAEAIRPICDQGIPVSVQNDVGPVCDEPLPEDLAIEPPGESVPAEMARFSGIWGNGGFDWFTGLLCTSLAVKSIEGGLMEVLLRKKEILLHKIADCSEFLRGSITSVCSTCNRAACICKDRPTGRAYRLTYQDKQQKTRTVYISRAQLPEARRMLANYKKNAKINRRAFRDKYRFIQEAIQAIVIS